MGILKGKLAVVTGAAGGIGLAICDAFLREGANVIGADINPPEPRPDRKELHFHPLDVTSESSVRDFRQKVAAMGAKLDVLVNNAGAMLGRPLLQTSVAEANHLMAVNVVGPFLVMRELVPLMMGSGAVINMSSGAAARPVAYMSVYSASKAAVSAMSKAAALEFAPIRVNSVLPGAIDTPMPRAFISNMPTEQQKAVMQGLKDGRVLKRLGRPEEVASMVLYLSSDAAEFVTGADFILDGGKI